MAIGTLGTNATTSLNKLPAWSQVVSAADIAAFAQSVLDDSVLATLLSGYGPGISALLATATTHGNTSLTAITRVSGAALAQVHVGDLVLGDGIAPGTFIQVTGGSTTATLSQATVSSTAGVKIIIARPGPPALGAEGLLVIPKRGILKVLPGDFPALDNTGWPILVSGASVGYAGSDWSSA
jgi:hypothetical protein